MPACIVHEVIINAESAMWSKVVLLAVQGVNMNEDKLLLVSNHILLTGMANGQSSLLLIWFTIHGHFCVFVLQVYSIKQVNREKPPSLWDSCHCHWRDEPHHHLQWRILLFSKNIFRNHGKVWEWRIKSIDLQTKLSWSKALPVPSSPTFPQGIWDGTPSILSSSSH